MLDALVGPAETAGCRAQPPLLGYFGEAGSDSNCDNLGSFCQN